MTFLEHLDHGLDRVFKKSDPVKHFHIASHTQTWWWIGRKYIYLRGQLFSKTSLFSFSVLTAYNCISAIIDSFSQAATSSESNIHVHVHVREHINMISLTSLYGIFTQWKCLIFKTNQNLQNLIQFNSIYLWLRNFKSKLRSDHGLPYGKVIWPYRGKRGKTSNIGEIQTHASDVDNTMMVQISKLLS